MQLTRRTALGAATIAAVAAAVAVLAVVTALVVDRPEADAPPEARKEPVAAIVTPMPKDFAHSEPRPVAVHARLLPNLRSLPAEDLSIELVDGVRRLRFASIIANTGVGPVETLSDDVRSCPEGQRHASQLLYHDANGNGVYERDVDVEKTSRLAGCMVFHAEHDHWHFDAAARYWLSAPNSLTPIAEAEKVSFCWRDNREVPAEADPRPPQFYGDCEQDTVQGITPGWADVYRASLPDQHLDLPADLPDGTYCLHNEADPLQLLLETNDDDNAAVLPMRLDGTAVAAGPEGACG
ncbi:MAG: lysyl oxidase family protein [Jiangellaceae bacterium]